MASPLCYDVIRQQQAELARRAERVRQTRPDEPLVSKPRRRRLAGALLGLGGLFRPGQRELALAPRGEERVPVAAGCLEVE
jgi:hypothetical protein